MIAASIAATAKTTDAKNGTFLVKIPVMLCMQVDPLAGVTPEEAAIAAAERLIELPLEVTLGGVPIAAEFPVKAES